MCGAFRGLRAGCADDDDVGREGRARERVAGLSASADGARELDEPEWRMGLRRHERDEYSRTPGEVGRQDTCPVPDRERSLRRRAAPQARRVPLVHAHDRVRPEAGREDTPPLRRGRLPHNGLHRTRRGDGRSARGRAESVHLGHHGLREEGRKPAYGMRMGSDRGLRQLPRQAELQSVWLLLHARFRNLADCVDGDGAGEVHQVLQGLYRHRQGRGPI